MCYPERDAIFGLWRKIFDEGELIELECPFCSCRVSWSSYKWAIGINGMRFCPYCAKDLWDNVQISLNLEVNDESDL